MRKDSPLIVGRTDGGNIIASDVPAVLKYTRDVVFIENEEIVKMTKEELSFLQRMKNQLRKQQQELSGM